ncbi:DUF937 domain-containing protein [Luteimonas sp. BDR2-5]|uniref:DUF937 domain-containing protein n=1 Tax=Proluteimonas luteida TaxID=2878685 RepID=UPI001E3B5AA0|nr:DUF937 domain-containing protein [Luteimonas sp. BDR2-5]MCD9028358.1 DUF937 domain-containing protein [Luteimonas sp. BDR2-5]
MTASLADQLLKQLDGAPLQQISQQLGLDPAKTASAVGTALPLLLGKLGHNAAQPQGAQSLLGALQRDYAGADLGSMLGAVLGGGGAASGANGAAILGHIFGGGQQHAEAQLGQATGLGSQQAGQLLKLLAPLVLAYLSKQFLQQGKAPAGDAGAADLGAALGQETRAAQQAGVGGLLGSILDQDGDGQLGIGDLLKVGGSLLGKS